MATIFKISRQSYSEGPAFFRHAFLRLSTLFKRIEPLEKAKQLLNIQEAERQREQQFNHAVIKPGGIDMIG